MFRMSIQKYRLGYKICGIAAGVVKGSALTQTAQLPMRRLAEQIDRNVVLCIMEHGVAMNVACSERGDSNMYMVKIGHTIPFYSRICRPCFPGIYGQRQGAGDPGEGNENEDDSEYKDRPAGTECGA